MIRILDEIPPVFEWWIASLGASYDCLGAAGRFQHLMVKVQDSITLQVFYEWLPLLRIF